MNNTQEQILFTPKYPKSIPLLTDREKEVLVELSFGYTDHEIGNHLSLSHHTVKSHRKRLIVKFDSRNTVHLVRQGIQLGIISLLEKEQYL